VYKDNLGSHGSPLPLGHRKECSNENGMAYPGCQRHKKRHTPLNYFFTNKCLHEFSILSPTLAHSLRSSFREFLLQYLNVFTGPRPEPVFLFAISTFNLIFFKPILITGCLLLMLKIFSLD